MRKVFMILFTVFIMALFMATAAFANPGKVGTTCTPCHTDGRTNPPKAAEPAKKTAVKDTAVKTTTKKTVKKAVAKKVVLPKGIMGKGAFASLLGQAAPADAAAALTWQEAAKMAVIAAGLEEDAKAMMANHANHTLADYVDQEKIWPVYRAYFAVAVKNGLINGAVVKGQKFLYPVSMAQEVYVKQVVNNAKNFKPQAITYKAPAVESHKESKMNHAFVLAGPFADGPSVTKACLTCHEMAAEHVLKTGHWKWQGASTHITGAESRTDLGKKNAINNYCVSVPGNEPRCTSCHAGYGWKDDKFDFNDKTKIDCLICHADLKASGYKKTPTGAGNPDPKADLVKAAQSVGKPKRENCGECHYYAGGGGPKNSVKQPALNDTLNKPTRDHDVHMGGKYNLACQSCHIADMHKIAGGSVNLTQRQDGMRVDCATCHNNGKPHKNAALNKHSQAVACQTCHIPTFGKSKDTKMKWDWSTAGDVYRNDGKTPDGNDNYSSIKGSFTWKKNVAPEYAWYNGKAVRYLMGDNYEKFKDAKGTIILDRPVGDIKDSKAKIYPFKVHAGKQPGDAINKTVLPIHTFGGYWKHYDWNKALTDGAKAAGVKYSGKYEFVETAMYMGVDHEVVPAAKALKCTDCHNNPNGRLDWKALGYQGDPWVFGSRK